MRKNTFWRKRVQMVMGGLLSAMVINSVAFATEETTTVEEATTMVEIHSEHCDITDIDAAKSYLEEYYQAILTKYYDYDTKYLNADFNKSHIPELRLGEPFYEYNVDGEQMAMLYFPLYREDDAVGTITLAYHGDRWNLLGEQEVYCLIFDIWNLLDEVDYENNDTIVYTINNVCYVETQDKCVSEVIYRMDEKDARRQSEEEKKFLKLSWKKKKALVDEGSAEFVKYLEYWNSDDDHSKAVVGFYNPGADNNPEEEKNLSPVMIGIIIWILVVILAVIIHKRKKK